MQTVASLVRSIQELMDELQIPPSTPLDNRVLGSLAIPSAEGIPILQTTEVRHDEMSRSQLSNETVECTHKSLGVLRGVFPEGKT